MGKGFQMCASFVIVIVVSAGGCHQCGPKASTGWNFQVLRPPIVTTESAVLAGSSSAFSAGATGFGQVVGPVGPGQFTTAAAPAMEPQQAPPCSARPERLGMPSQEPRKTALTCEEWCEVMRKVQQQQSAEPGWKALPKPKE